MELKYLLGYLPYELKGFIVLLDGGLSAIVNIGLDLVCASYVEIKPILRPLSDLDKEISVNGEKFTPIDCLSIKSRQLILNGDLVYPNRYNGIDLICHRDFEKLLELHFDLYGLIGLESAIDINTLNL
jgi:hypothetical protein|tara:strand:+ start:867 stop:1250 length:384 start_codon:yes stop_codon:yes gene_type:complete